MIAAKPPYSGNMCRLIVSGKASVANDEQAPHDDSFPTYACIHFDKWTSYAHQLIFSYPCC